MAQYNHFRAEPNIEGSHADCRTVKCPTQNENFSHEGRKTSEHRMMSTMRSRHFVKSSFREVREWEKLDNFGPSFVPIHRYRASGCASQTQSQEHTASLLLNPNLSSLGNSHPTSTQSQKHSLSTPLSPKFISLESPGQATEKTGISVVVVDAIQHSPSDDKKIIPRKKSGIIIIQPKCEDLKTNESSDEDADGKSPSPFLLYPEKYLIGSQASYNAVQCFAFGRRARRMAICEEIEKSSKPVKVNGLRMSINDLRRELIQCYPYKCTV